MPLTNLRSTIGVPPNRARCLYSEEHPSSQGYQFVRKTELLIARERDRSLGTGRWDMLAEDRI